MVVDQISNEQDISACGTVDLAWKLWIYTKYDCNLKCSYCVAKSGPNVPRRAIGLANVCRLVDEAVALGFANFFFTGGEPFLLNDIYDMLAYSSERVATMVQASEIRDGMTVIAVLQAALDRVSIAKE